MKFAGIIALFTLLLVTQVLSNCLCLQMNGTCSQIMGCQLQVVGYYITFPATSDPIIGYSGLNTFNNLTSTYNVGFQAFSAARKSNGNLYQSRSHYDLSSLGFFDKATSTILTNSLSAIITKAIVNTTLGETMAELKIKVVPYLGWPL